MEMRRHQHRQRSYIKARKIELLIKSLSTDLILRPYNPR